MDHSPSPRASASDERDGPMWGGLLAVGLMAIQVPVGVLAALGVVGFIILWSATRSFGTAIRFDLFFLLNSIEWLLGLVIAYLFGAIVRLAIRPRRSDTWLSPIVFFAALAVFTLGFSMFSMGMGWDGLSYWAGWVS